MAPSNCCICWYLYFAAIAIFGPLATPCAGRVTVESNPSDPFNPRVLVESSRPETGYAGPLHLFDSTYGMQHITLKMQMASGQHQCYYFILTEGYQLTLFAGTVSPGENKFHMFLATSDGSLMRSYSDQTSVSLVHNVTSADTYEACLVNPLGVRTLQFSAIYYQPLRYEAEVKLALSKSAIITNISDVTAKYISGIEVNIGKTLNNIRHKPNMRRDYLVLRDCNSYVQWKAIIFITIMLCSLCGTTGFIRYLFHVPKDRVAI